MYNKTGCKPPFFHKGDIIMTYSQIFKEIYRENKRFIRAYVTACLIFSILAFGSWNPAFAGSSFTTAETVEALGGSFGKMAAPFIQGYLEGLDTPSALVLLSGISVGLDVVPESTLTAIGEKIGTDRLAELSDYSFGILDFHAVKVICLIWFLLARLSKCNRISYTTGLILENFEVKIGAVVSGLVTASQFLDKLPIGSAVQAAAAAETVTATAATAAAATASANAVVFAAPAAASPWLNVVLCFVSLISSLVVYVLIRCLFFYVNIVLLPVCGTVPFFAFLGGVLKVGGMIGLLYVAVVNPAVFCVIFALVLILAIWLFKTAYRNIRYFKNIYVKPFFRKIRGYDSEIPLVAPKMPKKVRNFVKESSPEIVIPVYPVKKRKGKQAVLRHDRWWFVSAGNERYICKPSLMKSACSRIDLNPGPEEKIFIKKSLRFFELFSLRGTEDTGRAFGRIHKEIHLVFSKEYYYRFDRIKEITGYADYAEYKKQLKKNSRLSRAERRQAKLEAREERRMARMAGQEKSCAKV